MRPSILLLNLKSRRMNLSCRLGRKHLRRKHPFTDPSVASKPQPLDVADPYQVAEDDNGCVSLEVDDELDDVGAGLTRQNEAHVVSEGVPGIAYLNSIPSLPATTPIQECSQQMAQSGAVAASLRIHAKPKHIGRVLPNVFLHWEQPVGNYIICYVDNVNFANNSSHDFPYELH